MSETSPVQESMDINVIYLSIVGYSLIGDDELSQMDPPPPRCYIPEGEGFR
jgi:hypothetical protein